MTAEHLFGFHVSTSVIANIDGDSNICILRFSFSCLLRLDMLQSGLRPQMPKEHPNFQSHNKIQSSNQDLNIEYMECNLLGPYCYKDFDKFMRIKVRDFILSVINL